MGFGKVVGAALGAAAVAASCCLGSAYAFQVSGGATTAAAARALLNAINRDRATHHVAPLSLDQRESRCSLLHSKHMATLNSLSHDQFPADICVAHLAAGENVGAASGGSVATLLQLHRMMMTEGPCPDAGCPDLEFASHGHFVNLMNPSFKRIGIGVAVSNGATWLTEDFTG